MGLRSGRWKYFRRSTGPTLFDLVADPGETTNVADEHVDVVLRMNQLLDQWSATYPPPEADSEPLSEELREMLRSLGYIDCPNLRASPRLAAGGGCYASPWTPGWRNWQTRWP